MIANSSENPLTPPRIGLPPSLGLGGRPQILGPDGNPLTQPGMPVPHVYTFSSLFNLATRSYSWRWDEAYKNSRENALAMRRDCYLMGLLRERQYPVEQAPWHIEPEDPRDHLQQRICERLTQLVKAIPRFVQYKRAALEAEWYGRAAVQQKWSVRDVNGIPGITVSEFVPINGDKVQYSWDNVPRILIYAGTRPELEAEGAKVVITDRFTALELDKPYWRDSFLIHHGDLVDADFFEAEMAGTIKGVGIRHWLYWNDWIKKEIVSWVMDFLERASLGGIVVFYYEEGNPQSRAQADLAAKEYGRNTRIVWPRSTQGANVGSGMDVLPVPVSGAQFVLEIVRYFDEKAERFVVGQTMSGGRDIEGSLGGTGRAKLAKDTKWRVIASSANNLQETITQDLLGPMMRFNFPDVKFRPRFHIDLEDADLEAKLDAGEKLVGMGVELKVDELRKAGGYSKPEPNDQVVGRMAMGREQTLGEHVRGNVDENESPIQGPIDKENMGS